MPHSPSLSAGQNYRMGAAGKVGKGWASSRGSPLGSRVVRLFEVLAGSVDGIVRPPLLSALFSGGTGFVCFTMFCTWPAIAGNLTLPFELVSSACL